MKGQSDRQQNVPLTTRGLMSVFCVDKHLTCEEARCQECQKVAIAVAGVVLVIRSLECIRDSRILLVKRADTSIYAP